MNQVISWLQSIRLRQILTVFMVGITFLVSTTFDIHGHQLQARAEAVTPEATSYKTEKPTGKTGNILDKIEEAAENVKEKLNLDEPLDPGTKDVLNKIEGKPSDELEGTLRQDVKNTAVPGNKNP